MVRFIALGLVLASSMTVCTVDAFAAQATEVKAVAPLSAQNLTPEQIQAIVKLAVDGKSTVMINGQSVTVKLTEAGAMTVTMANGTTLTGQVTKQANGAIAVSKVQATSLTGNKVAIVVPVLAAGYVVPATVAVTAPGAAPTTVANKPAGPTDTASTDSSTAGDTSAGGSNNNSGGSGFGSGSGGGNGGGQVGNPTTPSQN